MFNKNAGTGNDELDQVIKKLGYDYDQDQKIFYSTLDAWQRNFGYCRLYDEAAALLSMIIDCEPIQFEYQGKRWLIQFWKGQYALTTGAEIGVYMTDRPDIDIPGIFSGPFYDVVSDKGLLQLSFILYRDGEALFSREDKHWWLTGFSLGEFSEPDDLKMHLTINLKDKIMAHAFVNGLKRVGYDASEITINGAQVSLLFAEPRTPQPATRTPSSDRIIQRKNEILCKMYQNITGHIEAVPDKFEAIKEQAPRLYNEAINIGKAAQTFESYDVLQRYIK